jgi:hypothetical protein
MNLYLQVILFTLVGWVNRHQQAVIEYLQAENQALREQLGNKRIRWTDAQRRRLAEKAKAIGRSALHQLGTVVTPDTLLRWYRNLVAAKYDGAKQRGPGRPRTEQDITELVVKMARESPTWGYTRLRGALYNLGHEVARNTIKNILLAHGLEPAPERGRHTSWRTFIKLISDQLPEPIFSPWKCSVAGDSFGITSSSSSTSEHGGYKSLG